MTTANITGSWVLLISVPMTVLGLMQNLIDAARYSLGLERAAYPFDYAAILEP